MRARLAFPSLFPMALTVLVFPSVTSVLGCTPTSAGPTGTSPDGTTKPDAAVQPDLTMNNTIGRQLTFTLDTFDVMPGTERQVCKTVLMPTDGPFDAVRFHSTMSEHSHHFDAYKVLMQTGPVAPADMVLHDCQPAAGQLDGTAAIIIGSTYPENVVETPTDVSYHLLPGQPIILEQHMINAGTTTIQGGVTFDMWEAGDVSTIQHHADMVWMANWNIILPMGQTTSSSAKCAMPYDVETFALTSHTHSLGTDVTITKMGATDVLYENLDWSHPKYTPIDPRMAVKKGDGFAWTCTWDNTTDHQVTAGKYSTDEMCITYAYAYPTATLDATPIVCNTYF